MDEGKIIWSMANAVFDYMPFAATIDDVIFCVHGGIPRPLSTEETALESIDKIPCPTAVRVTTTDARSKQIKQLSSDLLWSDPAQHEQEKRLDGSGDAAAGAGPDRVQRLAQAAPPPAQRPVLSGCPLHGRGRLL